MNILMLGPRRPEMISFMESIGDRIFCTEEAISPDMDIAKESDLVVSYGYKIIVRKELLDLFPNKAINLHISYLPFNRGADPNLWSFLEDTPKGVTIHYMVPEVDAGDILAQRKVTMLDDDTLKSSYERLTTEIEKFFREVWPKIRTGQRESYPQPDGGTTHLGRQKKQVDHLLSKGWETPVAELIGQRLSVERKA